MHLYLVVVRQVGDCNYFQVICITNTMPDQTLDKPVRWQIYHSGSWHHLVHLFPYNQHLSIIYFARMLCTGNMGNLFFIIIPAICEESDNPFGSSDCSTDGDAYASLSSAVLILIPSLKNFPIFLTLNTCLLWTINCSAWFKCWVTHLDELSLGNYINENPIPSIVMSLLFLWMCGSFV